MLILERLLSYPTLVAWLEFFAKTIDSIAWPAVVLGVFILFRRPLQAMIASISKLRIWDTEIQVEREAKEIVSDAQSAGITTFYPAAIFPRVAQVNQREFIISQWIEIERQIDRIWSGAITSKPSQKNTAVSQKVEDLRRSNLISADLASLILRIRRLRNELAHSNENGFMEAEREELLGTLKSVRDRLVQIEVRV